MDRREFLINGLMAAGGAAIAPTAFLSGCTTARIYPQKGPGLDKLLYDGVRVMWSAAHPDDEALVGAIMAKSSLAYNNPLYFLILTHGDGGECCRPQGCLPDLATVRGEEMKKVAELYKAELQHESYFNAPLPVESFPKRHELAKIWNDKKDVTRLYAEAIRRWKPDVIFTFCPVSGFTGHPEHQLASRFTMAGIRMAADSAIDVDGLPAHRVSYLYLPLNRYWPVTAISGQKDAGPVTETWDPTQYCKTGWQCRDIMAHFSKAHQSQNRDMGSVRTITPLMRQIYLRLIDPFTEIYDPFEPRPDQV